MTALSIHLPDNLAKASQVAASRLGISRTEFIRQAISHEIENLSARAELEAMAKSFSVMKQHKAYTKEAKQIDKNFNIDLPDEEDSWWKKK